MYPKVKIANNLVPEEYDEIVIAYDEDDIETVTYKKSSVAVVTLSFEYSGGNLVGITSA